MGEWITMKEACELLGVAPNTIRRLVRRGVLPAYEIRGVRGYQLKRADVEGLISPVKVNTPAEEPAKRAKSKRSPRP